MHVVLLSFVVDVSGYLNCFSSTRREKGCFLKEVDYIDLANVEKHANDPGKIGCKGILYDATLPIPTDLLPWLQELSTKVEKSCKARNVHYTCSRLYGQVISFSACLRAVKNDLDVNSSGIKGQTMLHMAFCQRNYLMQMLLLGKGASLALTDSEGNYPFVQCNSDGYGTKQNVNILEKYFVSLLRSPYPTEKLCGVRAARLCQKLDEKDKLCFILCILDDSLYKHLRILNDSFRNGVKIVIQRFDNTESKLMGVYENSRTSTNAPENTSAGVTLEEYESLFSKHSNLNMITRATLRSKGFGNESHVISKESCAVLYCHHKGYKPYGEREFPKALGKYKTDIREGYFCFASNELKLGEKIKRSGMNKTGSLGGFVDLHEANTEKGFITCAHVFHASSELKAQSFRRGNTVYQVTDIGESAIGKIKEAVFTPDRQSQVSVDAALVEIHPGVRISGTFPDIGRHQLHFSGIYTY